jgi:hypothetical protein
MRPVTQLSLWGAFVFCLVLDWAARFRHLDSAFTLIEGHPLETRRRGARSASC